MTCSDVKLFPPESVLEFQQQAMDGDPEAAVAFVCLSIWRRIKSGQIPEKKKVALYSNLIKSVNFKVVFHGRK